MVPCAPSRKLLSRIISRSAFWFSVAMLIVRADGSASGAPDESASGRERGTNPEYAQYLVRDAGLTQDRVRLDYRAEDTLGNFTSLVDELQRDGVHHLLLVTSEDHLPRAMAVGGIVAGSRGIRLTGVAVSCQPQCRDESLGKRIGDGLRAAAWVITGQDFKPWARRHWPQLFSSQ